MRNEGVRSVESEKRLRAARFGQGTPFNRKGTWTMGLLDNVLGSAVPGGRYAKPLGIALLALLAARKS